MCNAENVKTRVPQGLTLGPLLCLLYINDLPNATTFKTMLFADDTVLLLSHKNLDVLQQQVTRNLQKILTWLYKNKLCLIKKTNKYMLFTLP